MTTWCLVPARGGSKGLPGKNLRKAGGLSLVARAVFAARQFALQAGETQVRVIVDTDDPTIAAEAVAWGAEVPFLRAADLAGDAVGSVDTVLGFFDRLRAGEPDDIVVLLQPTSPLRQADDIALVWHAVAHAGAESAAAVAPTTDRVDFALVQDAHGRLSWLGGDDADGRRRQDAVATMHLTGAVYAIRLAALRRTRRFVASGVTFGVPLPESGAVDVDTADDLALADLLLHSADAPTITVRGRAIGRGEPCFVIATAELALGDDASTAERLIEAAVQGGADALMVREAVGAQAHAIRLLASRTDTAGADTHAVAGSLISSADLTDQSLLASLAQQGTPLFIALEGIDLPRIGEALLTIRRHGAPPVVLLPSADPSPEPHAAGTLSAISTLTAAFRVPIGWYDCTSGTATSIAAAALGARVLALPLCLSRRADDSYGTAALEPEEFAALVRDLRTVQATLSRDPALKERTACATSS